MTLMKIRIADTPADVVSAIEQLPRPVQPREVLLGIRESAAFEAWLESNCPSGDAESVMRKWEASSDYADFFLDQDLSVKASAFSHESFGDRLRMARQGKRLTQAESAMRASMTPAAWSHFETGQRTPHIRNLRAICKALRISADYLLGL